MTLAPSISIPNGKSQSMFLHRKAAKLICKAREVAHVAHLRTIASPPICFSASSPNVSRTMVTMNKDGGMVDPCELEAIFEQKRSLRSKVRKALKNMDPIQRFQEGRYNIVACIYLFDCILSVRLFVSMEIPLLWVSDNAIQNIVLESSWFKASKSLCAYISSPALREVDTSRIISEVLSSPAKGSFLLFLIFGGNFFKLHYMI